VKGGRIAEKVRVDEPVGTVLYPIPSRERPDANVGADGSLVMHISYDDNEAKIRVADLRRGDEKWEAEECDKR
jgi:hypothetical protein